MPPKYKGRTQPTAKQPKQRRRRRNSEADPDFDIEKKPRERKRHPTIESFRFVKEKIPEEKLRNAIYNVLTETTENYNCYKDICSLIKDQHIPAPIPDCYVRTQYEARNCLLNQDWTNFSRLLFLLVQNEKKNADYSTSTFKYFLLALLHDPEVKDKDFLESFLSSVFDCNSPSEIRNFLREVSTLKKMEYSTKMKTKVEIQTTVKLPEVDMDTINLEHAKNVRKLFLGQKRKVPNLHRKNARKYFTKQ